MKHLVESKYDGRRKGYYCQVCGACGYNEFIDTTTTKEKDVIITTAKCLNCGKINVMHRRTCDG